jgi:hypothetical protein
MQLGLGGVDVIKKKLVLTVTHNDQTLTFSGTTFRYNIFEEEDVFRIINLYLQTLSVNKQAEIFEHFAKIRYDLENIWDKNTLYSKLSAVVSSLYSLFDFDTVKEWILKNINIPNLEANFSGTYEPSMDDSGSRDQTYLRSDYTDLVTLSVLLRLMLPIWHEFIERTKKEYGNSFKEYYAFRILRNSNLYHCRAMDKLVTWISFPITAHLDDSQLILSGISSEDIPQWLLALVVIRRLVIGKIEGADQNVHLITYIHKFVIRKIQTSKLSGSDMIRPKKTRTDDENEDKESSLDRYKIKYNVAPGEVVEMEFALSNTDNLIKMLAPQLDMKLVETNLQTVQRLQQVNLIDEQIILLSWVTSKVISTKGILYLNKSFLLNIMAVAQAIYTDMGYPAIGFMLTAYPVKTVDYLLTTTDGKSRVPKEIIDDLSYHYPFVKRSGRKGNVTKTISPAMAAIDRIVSGFSSKSWALTASDDQLRTVYGDYFTRQWSAPSDIRTQLCKALISLLKTRGI